MRRKAGQIGGSHLHLGVNEGNLAKLVPSKGERREQVNTASDYVTNVLSPMCIRVKCPSEEDAYAHLQKHMPGTYKCAPTHGNVLVVHCMEKSKFVNKRLLTARFSSYESLTLRFTLDVKGGTLRHVNFLKKSSIDCWRHFRQRGRCSSLLNM